MGSGPGESAPAAANVANSQEDLEAQIVRATQELSTGQLEGMGLAVSEKSGPAYISYEREVPRKEGVIRRTTRFTVWPDGEGINNVISIQHAVVRENLDEGNITADTVKSLYASVDTSAESVAVSESSVPTLDTRLLHTELAELQQPDGPQATVIFGQLPPSPFEPR